MARSNIKKESSGYGYNYTTIAQIHEALEKQGCSYYQFIETQEGEDYIFTVPIINGEEKPPRRGCKVVVAPVKGKDGKDKTNPAQAYGSGLTYARRYSLLMAFGLATTDDDAQTFDNAEELATYAQRKAFADKCSRHGWLASEILNELGVTQWSETTAKDIEKGYEIIRKRLADEKGGN